MSSSTSVPPSTSATPIGSPATTTTDTLSAGAIAGIAVGIAVVCLVLLAILVLAMRRKQQESQRRRRGVRCVSISSPEPSSGGGFSNANATGGGLARPMTARERAGAIVRGEILNTTSRTTGNFGAGTVPRDEDGERLESVHVEMEEVGRPSAGGSSSRNNDNNKAAARNRTRSDATSSIGTDSGVDADSMASLPVIAGGVAAPHEAPGLAPLPSSSSFSAASTSSQGGRRVPSFEQAKARETWWSSSGAS